jgi:hypothetical protein
VHFSFCNKKSLQKDLLDAYYWVKIFTVLVVLNSNGYTRMLNKKKRKKKEDSQDQNLDI